MADKEADPVQDSYVLFETWTLMHSVGALLNRVLEGSGMNADEFGFYSVVIDNQPITPKRISELVGMPPTTVSSFLSRMIERGHASKKKNPADGRSFLVELTPLGFETQYGAWRRFLPAQDAVIDHLEVPVDDVSRALQLLTDAVRAATPPG
ncbi:MAG: MarR family winged helix-turn-helix transcriptional regulator [Gaiellaceae bacterium]